MKLTKFGILVNKTTSLFTSIRDSKISRGCAKILEIPEGRGVNFEGRFWKILRGGGVIGEIPSVGGDGYFLEPHNLNEQNFKVYWKIRIKDQGSVKKNLKIK